ncbi:MAG: spermidine/putrescine ABC transporter substrate-binding protein [Clostridia bacterium]|nr:spermidine/putrescine ABC transporter substrate-binding protein [Clostridia bacterium]
MKKLAVLLLVALVIPLIVSCNSDRPVVYVCNWGEYISDGLDDSMDVNREFEERTGIKVVYDNFTSNEDLYAKLKAGGTQYDIIIPSDYMVERLIAEGLVQKINFDNIPNYVNILDEYKNLPFDPNNEYSVPYNVGMVGLIYNTKEVEGVPDSWEILWDQKYSGKILNFKNPRDAFAIAQFALGLNINSTDTKDWDAAAIKLVEQKPLLQMFVMDEVFNKMETGEAILAPYYAGDYFTMAENNPDLAFVYPKEGTNRFVDSICIPANAKNKENAEKYINFLLESDVALANAEYIYYASPNKTVVENPDYLLYQDEITYPSQEVMANTQSFTHLPNELIEYMNRLWSDILMK